MTDNMLETDCFTHSAVESIESVEKYDAIKELICKASVFSKLRNKKKLENAVFKREKLMSTAIGRGVAVAHGKTKAVTHTMVAFGISKSGILFDSPDGKPVHLLFLVANPPRMYDEYLMILSAIARMSGDESLQNDIISTNSTNNVIGKVSRALSFCIHEKEQLAVHTN